MVLDKEAGEEAGTADALYWRHRDLSELELFKARFRTHKYRRHSHAGYVIGIITEGCEDFYCRGSVHRATLGDIILINPESQHDGESGSGCGWAYRVMYPLENHFRAVSELVNPPRFRNSVVKDSELASRIMHLHRILEAPTPSMAAQVLWSQILFDLSDRYAEGELVENYASNDPPRIARIEEILRAHAINGIGLDEVAAQVGWSQWHMVRSFQAARGVSPHAFALECRLRHAKGLIDAGASLAQASAEAGFYDQSHFSRHFVRAYGLTPGRYRRSLIK